MNTIQPDLLEAAVAALPDDGLAASRKAAVSRFLDAALPTTRHEDWRYTDLKRAIDISNDWLARPASIETTPRSETDERIDEISAQIDAHWIVMRNGIVDGESVERLTALGINVVRLCDSETTSLFDAAAPLSVLNSALLRDGICLRTASGVELEQPVGILLADDAIDTVNVTQSRILLDLGRDSHLKLLECQVSAGEQEQFANTLTQVAMARGAKLDLVRLQQRRDTHLNVNRLDVRLEQDAALNCTSFDFGGALVRNDIAADIIAPGASVRLQGLYLASGRQHIDNHTRVDHRVGPAISHEEYRGILTGNSRCVFNGKAVVHDGADGTDAHQSNHNLLLSRRAEIDTKPELEIYADDVKCSHGATVGQLDKAALFYLRSRGLDREEASRLLTRAFAAGLLSALPIDAAHDYIAQALDGCLDQIIDHEVQ